MELKLCRKRSAARKQQGMTLIELMVAMVVLLVGVVGSMSLVALSMGDDGRSRQQSNSTTLVQMVTEKLSSVNASSTTTVQITDCTGATFTLNTSPGGANLLASGVVDYTQSPAPADYSMTYTECGTNGRQVTYDVRWKIQVVSPYVKSLTISSKQLKAGSDLKYFSLPVTFHTLMGQGT